MKVSLYWEGRGQTKQHEFPGKARQGAVTQRNWRGHLPSPAWLEEPLSEEEIFVLSNGEESFLTEIYGSVSQVVEKPVGWRDRVSGA